MYRNGKYRTFSAVRVVDEMERIKQEYKTKEIYFDDDDFTINREHVLSICSEILKRNLKLKWSCMADAINLDQELLEKMAQSGCIGIKFGVESASPKILSQIGKPVDLKKVQKIARLSVKYGIKSHATFTLGLWNETEEDMKKTVRFAQDLAVNSIQVSIATPFPGTEFFYRLEERGFLKTKDWKLYDGKISEIVSYPGLSWSNVVRARRKALRNWFLKQCISPFRIYNQAFILIRTLKRMGLRMFTRKFRAVIIDELKNR